VLQDPFFRFWFRYVFPNLSYLEEGELDYVWEQKIVPGFESFVGPVFEQICTQRLTRLNRENALPFKASRIGRWWERTSEFDIIGYNTEGDYLFCECKWSMKPVGEKILEQLQEKTHSFPEATRIYWGLFSCAGFHVDLYELATTRSDVLLFEY
jgi:AAA+ ATPase superfamily predicted ATPase